MLEDNLIVRSVNFSTAWRWFTPYYQKVLEYNGNTFEFFAVSLDIKNLSRYVSNMDEIIKDNGQLFKGLDVKQLAFRGGNCSKFWKENDHLEKKYYFYNVQFGSEE